MVFHSEKEIEQIVRVFENGTIKREDWRHAEHLTVAFYYAYHHDFETALNKMRDGIFNLLRSFEVDLTKEMPYHETLTVFWMRKVSEFLPIQNNAFVDTANRILKTCQDKDLPLKVYTRELLFSDEARKKFVKGDLEKDNF